MTGGLFDPLGTDRDGDRRRASRPSAAVVVSGLALAAIAGLLVASWFRDDGGRGRPVAVSPIERVEVQPKPPNPAPAETSTAPPAPAAVPAADPQTSSKAPSSRGGLPSVRDDQEVEIQNGVRIIRPRRDAPASGGQTIRVPDGVTPR